MKQKTDLIVALDVATRENAENIVRQLAPVVKIFKVASQLFTTLGPAALEIVLQNKAKAFLDLKFHDIPNTVANVSRVAVRLGVTMFTVHAQGGKEMMRAAFSAANDEAKRLKVKRPLIFGVTVLTSQEDNQTKIRVLELSRDIKESGLDGMVCSVQEAFFVRKAFGKNLLIMCPGIRLAGEKTGDQKRIATPQQAKKSGADFIVMGRSIIAAKNPLGQVKKILKML
jgi:orotidine-5'-phosphate decarboxylase